MKVSAVKPEHRSVEAPARIFEDQESVRAAYKEGELDCDVVVVVRFQGPRANGMPELHALTPVLSVLQDRGFKVALLTDGRMSGASGRIPAVIHVSPEARDGGMIGKLRDGDVVRIDAERGTVDALSPNVAARVGASPPDVETEGCGRELFQVFREAVGSAESGAAVIT